MLHYSPTIYISGSSWTNCSLYGLSNPQWISVYTEVHFTVVNMIGTDKICYKIWRLCCMLTICFLLWKGPTLIFHKCKQNRRDCTLKHSLLYLIYIAYVTLLISCCTNQSLYVAWQVCNRSFRLGQQSWTSIKTKEMWIQKMQQRLKKEELNRSKCTRLSIFYRFPGD